MNPATKVLVSHSGKQGNVYQRPRAAEQAGLSTTFLTGLYYFPDRIPYSLVHLLPIERRKKILIELEKRRQEGLSPQNVVSLMGPWIEVALRPMGLINEWAIAHDWLAAKWVRRRGADSKFSILHAFQGNAIRTLQVSKGVIPTRLLEVTLPPMPAAQCDELNDPGFAQSQARATDRLSRELEHCEWAVVQSAFSVRAIEAMGFPRESILCVPLGVDVDVFKPPANFHAEGAPLRVLFIGTICRRKGVHHLLKAWNQLRPAGAELVIVGNCETPEARELLSGCDSSVLPLGNLSFEKLLAAYQSADILVHPSLAEGGCNVVHEALACGLPCIVTQNTTSAVRNGVDGFVLDVGDIEGFKRAIVALRDPELRYEMSRSARQQAINLSWSSYLQRLGSVYRELGSGSRRIPQQATFEAVFGQRTSQSQ
jgi:glycosyltransferase involved in cell wall biosynthesis